ncbi:sulfite exporter TauE/SafE family protein [Modestobacter sp. Leaf380]|uniref:sulfite exporter TauE/SafE family protein n=1 Tax=Modestobacter sp. Leaf380 TaxID=1736356 RepID=UPI000B296F9B|nr:sulfite exporter TauE/SafE family protein [Modestobacter sp. Leaf380]
MLAGLGAGLTGSVAGLASLVSYPALLATGLPPVTANVTNTVALVLNSVGAVGASRPELRGQGRRIALLLPLGMAGGVAGAALLLTTPPSAFEAVVPFFIAAASVLILLQRPPRELASDGTAEARRHPRRALWAMGAGVAAVSVYGGFFGAASGVLLLAVLLLTTGETVARGNALKNTVSGASNLLAAIGFALFADVAWAAVLPLAAGLFVGGVLGPPLVRRLPGLWLRRGIGVAGLVLAAVLASA